MRQRNHIENVIGTTSAKSAADHLVEFRALDELHDCESPDRNNQPRLQDLDLLRHPRRAVSNFIWRGNAVGAAGRFSGKTSTHGREINSRANSGFVHSAKLFEPTKQRLTGSVRERAFQRRLAGTGRLSNDHYITHHRATGNGR